MQPKDKTLYAQNEVDAKVIKSQGFTDVRMLSKKSHFENIKLEIVLAYVKEKGLSDKVIIPADGQVINL